MLAANQFYGQHNTAKRPQENIGMFDSLLSRFDLLFIVLDQLDSGLDRTISSIHILVYVLLASVAINFMMILDVFFKIHAWHRFLEPVPRFGGQPPPPLRTPMR